MNTNFMLITVILLLSAAMVFAGGGKEESQEELVVLRVGGLSAVAGWNPYSNTSPLNNVWRIAI